MTGTGQDQHPLASPQGKLSAKLTDEGTFAEQTMGRQAH